MKTFRKVPVKYFLSGLRDLTFFTHVSDRFSDLFSGFSNLFLCQAKTFSRALSFCKRAALLIGTRQRGHYERGFSLEASLESLKSLESLENGRALLSFPQSGGFSIISTISKISRNLTFLKRPPFRKTPVSEPELKRKQCFQSLAMKDFCFVRKCQFVHKFLFTILVPLNPPLPTSKVGEFS